MEENIIIDVSHVTVRFNLANQKVDNLKEYVIRMLKRELMFQEFLAVRDVSFRVLRGEAWGIIGANGSGKSTLLKAISGILQPCRGSIQVNGQIAPMIELGAGFDEELTARENIYLNGCVLGHTEKYMKEKLFLGDESKAGLCGCHGGTPGYPGGGRNSLGWGLCLSAEMRPADGRDAFRRNNAALCIPRH